VLKIPDGERQPFSEPLNRHISATVPVILMNFCTITHIGPIQRIDRYNFKFLKIQDGGCSVPHKRNVPKFRQLSKNGTVGEILYFVTMYLLLLFRENYEELFANFPQISHF